MYVLHHLGQWFAGLLEDFDEALVAFDDDDVLVGAAPVAFFDAADPEAPDVIGPACRRDRLKSAVAALGDDVLPDLWFVRGAGPLARWPTRR